MTELADGTLLREAQRGDQQAFDTLVHRHTARLYRVAYRILGSGPDAEDCLQDTWLSVWQHLHSFRGEAQVSTYLYRIVTNAALMRARKRRPVHRLDGVPEPADDPSARPDHVAMRTAAAAAVHCALGRLGPLPRASIVLREFEGLSHEEMAHVLQISVPAVKSRLHRARLALAAELAEWR